MRRNQLGRQCFFYTLTLLLSSCANQIPTTTFTPFDAASSDLPLYRGAAPYSSSFNEERFASRLPQNINLGHEKVIMVDPQKFAWGAYDANGKLVRAGIASAGADFCQDEKHPCRTSVGIFRVHSLGNEDCISREYPIGKGGALMPYCMFFHHGQSLHGAPDKIMVEANLSHGCVHIRIPDVEWLRYHFVELGTKVVVMPYPTTNSS